MKNQQSEQNQTQLHHNEEDEEEHNNIEQSSSKSPSPPLHSLSDSPISDDHRSLPLVLVQPPLVTAHRFQVEPAVVTRVDPGAEEGFVGFKDVEGEQERDAGGGGGGGGDGGGVEGEREQDATSGGGVKRGLRPDVKSLLRSEKVVSLNKVLLGLRVAGFVFCLVSWSVLAADRKKGWAIDSFYLYKEFRCENPFGLASWCLAWDLGVCSCRLSRFQVRFSPYSLSVNVIGFVYSAVQICDLVKYLITKKHIVEHKLRGYFTFALDQILTYLLMSASSSAATRAYDWESNWGNDKFPFMANASVVLSFIAFAAFALTSLVSGSIVCRFR
ncbi:hypothetical protein MtrunA17_Chr7g0228001 [Medicago truncatula]|uniref:CASP-like protein n=1 Tax=Medicago truncatula TaxID=3880 RepID=A0A396GVS4_MEDTR|nr:hypothetical protein MtrunA17_Chr7g0228001 [Medicago truncatula]